MPETTQAQPSRAPTNPSQAPSPNPSPTLSIVNWFEIPVTDLERSRRLYAAIFDVELELSDFGGVPHALLANRDRTCISGALVADPKRPPRNGSGTVLYLDAPDGVARCLARAAEAGAKIVQPLTPVAPHGAIALFEDLDGNLIGLHEHPKA